MVGEADVQPDAAAERHHAARRRHGQALDTKVVAQKGQPLADLERIQLLAVEHGAGQRAFMRPPDAQVVVQQLLVGLQHRPPQRRGDAARRGEEAPPQPGGQVVDQGRGLLQRAG